MTDRQHAIAFNALTKALSDADEFIPLSIRVKITAGVLAALRSDEEVGQDTEETSDFGWITPAGLKRYRVIVGPNGEVFQPASCWVVDVDVDREKELRHDLKSTDHLARLLERKYAARWLSKELKDQESPAED